ncbi:hypothetical protein V6N11_008543 [Hibiscus sabdariffa]|uniref:Uncharacterized protein n=1 Tax=Hibiscus sabdariffa TaxID=183260 RepID=A0ABR2PNM9_9ROSI
MEEERKTPEAGKADAAPVSIAGEGAISCARVPDNSNIAATKIVITMLRLVDTHKTFHLTHDLRNHYWSLCCCCALATLLFFTFLLYPSGQLRLSHTWGHNIF